MSHGRRGSYEGHSPGGPAGHGGTRLICRHLDEQVLPGSRQQHTATHMLRARSTPFIGNNILCPAHWYTHPGMRLLL